MGSLPEPSQVQLVCLTHSHSPNTGKGVRQYLSSVQLCSIWIPIVFPQLFFFPFFQDCAETEVDRNKCCTLCNMFFTSSIVAQSHYQGKTHAKRIRLVLGEPQLLPSAGNSFGTAAHTHTQWVYTEMFTAPKTCWSWHQNISDGNKPQPIDTHTLLCGGGMGQSDAPCVETCRWGFLFGASKGFWGLMMQL